MPISPLDLILLAPPSALTALGAVTLGEGGGKVQRFKKELIRVGSFQINQGERTLDVSLEDLNSWAQQFDAMKLAGHKVSIPATHEAHGDPKKNQGWVDSMFVEDERLFGVLELHGDAIQDAAKSDVSIWAVPNFVDGQGNKYDFPIRHVAMTTDPQIPGMKEFVAIAASNDDKPVDTPVFKHQDKSKPKPKEGITMNFAKIIAAMCGVLSLSVDGFKETMSEIDFTKALKTAFDGAITKATDALKLQVTDLQKQVKDGGGVTEIKLSANERYLSNDMLQTKLNTLVTECKLDAAASEALRDELATDLMLSIDTGTKKPNYQRILDALAKNNPLKQFTAANEITLAHPQPDDEESRVKTQERMATSLNPAASK